MLALKVNGIWIDLPLKLAITLTFSNPIFDSEAIERVFSYPFKIPLTAHNQTVFINTERLDVDVNNDEYEAELYLNGILVEVGIIKITSYKFEPVDRSYINVSFQNKARNLADQLADINIDEILETITIPQTITSRFVLYAASFSVLHIEINNISIFEGITGGSQSLAEQLERITDQINQAFDEIYASFHPVDQTVTIHNPDNISLSIRILNGFVMQENISLAMARQLNMLQYIDSVVNSPSPSHSFVTMFNRLFYESENDSWLGFINFWRNGESLINEEELNLAWKHTVVPFVRLPYIFDQICENLDGFNTIFGEFYDSIDVQQSIMYNHYALDEVFQYLNTGETQKTVYLNGFKDRIDLNNHVLDISASDYFSAFAELTCTYYRIVGNDIEVVRKVDQLRQTPLDWTSRVEPAYDAKNQLNQGVTLDYQSDPDDTYQDNSQLQPAVIGEGEMEINTTISSLRAITQTVDIDEIKLPFSWTLPIVRQSGSSDETGNSNHTFRILFDRGLQADNDGVLYPFGTHSNINYEGEQVGDLSLDWNAPQGLLTQLWEEFTDTIDKDEITMNFRLYVTDILHIKRWENSRRIIHHPKGTLNAIIKSVQCKVSVETGLTFAKITMLKVA